jgi:hypothetical protein
MGAIASGGVRVLNEDVVSWYTHQEQVQRRAERPGHLVPDGHAPARQREHHHIAAAAEMGQTRGQRSARRTAITERLLI